MIGQETTKLLDYLPTNLYDWQWCTCSDGHITPAQKPNHSITCNSLLTRLPVWFPDRQSCPYIKYNCAPHTCPFRLLSPKPQTYPSVNMSKITACLYTRVIVTKLPVYPHKHFLAILHGALQTCLYIYASPYTQIFQMINTPVVSSQLSTYISTRVIVSLDQGVSVEVDLRG